MKRLAVVAAALLLAGCGGDDDDAKEPAETMKLESQLTGVDRVPTTAPAGADTQLRVVGQLYEPGDAKATGRSQTACVRTQRGAGEVYNCTVVFVLPEGRLYGVAIASEDGPASGAIVGGTREFARASGTFEYGSRSGQRVALAVELGD